MTDHLKTIRESINDFMTGNMAALDDLFAALDALEQAMREPVAAVRVLNGRLNGTQRRAAMSSLPDGDYELFAAPPAQQANEWREAVLDKLTEHCIDAPIGEPPATILGRIIEVAIAMHEVCKNAPAEPCEPFNAPAQQAQPSDTERAYLIGFADGKQAQAEAVPQWIDSYEKTPEDGQECLVYSRQHWEKTPSVKMDTWQEQHEAPVSFSSATIPIGVGWDAHNFEDVIAWMPLPAAPQPKEQSNAVCRSDGKCQYAIDHDAEKLGHCPTGKCVMPRQAETALQPKGGSDMKKLLPCPFCGGEAEIERTHYTPEDVADASAQGFRDGVASVTAGQEPVHQFRNPHCSDWYDGVPDHSDGGGPYEERTLYAAPVAQQPRQCGLCGSDEAFTGTCGGGRRDPRALCYESVSQQPQAEWIDGVPHWTPELIAKWSKT